MNTIIAIDGPSASGKTLLARRLAKDFGFSFVGTGLMYRSVTLSLLRRCAFPLIEEEILEHFNKITFSLERKVEEFVLSCDGHSFREKELKTDAINEHISFISAIDGLRKKLVSLQRDCLKKDCLVMEGRDIGSHVFPNTPYKIYVDAEVEIRKQRRRGEGSSENLNQRDKTDSQRKVSPLIFPEGAQKIDTSYLNPDEVFKQAKSLLLSLGINL